MIVCSCRSVSDRSIKAALAAGASREEILQATRAGSDCGRCRPHVESLLEEANGGGGCCGGPCESCSRRAVA